MEADVTCVRAPFTHELQIGFHDLLFDREHAARLRVDAELDPVNESFAVRLHARKEFVGERLVHHEEVIVAVPAA